MFTTDPELATVIRLVQQRLPADFQLSKPQLLGIQAAWEGKGYKYFAGDRCTAGHISNLMMPIFAQLSESFGTEVRKSNFRRLIETSILGKVFFEEDPNKPPIIGSPPKNETFIGRNLEKNIIDEKLFDNKLILITGPGGIGKTSLAANVFQKLSKTNNYEKYIWHPVYPGSVDENLFELLKILGVSKTLSAINGFLDYISQHKIFIVIDGADFWSSKYLNDVNHLVKRIIDHHHQSLVFITCSQSILLAKNLQDQEYPIFNCKLEGLLQEDSRELFRVQGIFDKKIDRIIDSSRGIPATILDACKKIKLLSGDIDQYLRNKTIFITNSAKERLNNLFINESSGIHERERFILFYLVYKISENAIAINNFTQELEVNSRYTLPEIIESIEVLERNSLVSIDKSSKSIKLIKHDEVRGYLVQDPLSLFGFT
jgi:hypothetical protein